MSDENGAVYWIFVVARSSDRSLSEVSTLQALDAVARRTDAAIVVDGF
jgi:hypothetical protein